MDAPPPPPPPATPPQPTDDGPTELERAWPVSQPEVGPGVGQKTIEDGKMMGYLSYVSYLIGLPLFLIPMIQRDNAFALYHAKHAAVSYGLGVLTIIVLSIVTAVTCGFGAFLFPLALFPWVTSIHGFMIVSNGEFREPALCFHLADRFLNNLHPKQG